MSRRGSALARLRTRPLLFDGVLAVLVIGLGVVGLFTGNDNAPAADSPDALALLLVIGAGAPVAVRRRWPEVALLTALAATVTFYLLGYASPTIGIATLLFVYTVAAHRQLKVAAPLAVGSLAALYVLIAADAPRSGGFAAYFSNTLTTLVAYSIGRNVRTRRAYTAALEERAAHAEAERAALAGRAVAEERRRLARELHDVVAHHVSVMGVLAAGARRSLGRADAAGRADETLATIETTARTTLRELRRLLDVLREDEDEPSGIPPAPQPGLEMLPTLVQQVRDAGLPVEVTVEGSATSLPPGVDLSAYRILQEALTNSLRHGGPARALVRLSYADNGVTRTLKEVRCRRRDFRMRCCVGDGGGPSGTALQGEVPNHRKLLRLRAVVVSVAEKAHEMRQVWIEKANVSEPLRKRRKRSDVIETGVQLLPWDGPGGCLLIGQVVTGVEVARARFRHRYGTCEPVAPARLTQCWTGRWEGAPQAAETARGGVPMRGTGADRLVVAVKPGNAGGAKGTGRLGSFGDQPVWPGGVG